MLLKTSHKLSFWVLIFLALILYLTQGITNPQAEKNSPLIITEFLAANQNGLLDEDGDSSDWIELYNQSKYPVSLADWSLSDDVNHPEKWIFPNITLPSKSYLLLFASAKNRRPTDTQANLHTNFKLNKQGGTLSLYQPTSRRFIDAVSITYPPQQTDISYGWYDEQTNQKKSYVYFASPTPKSANQSTSIANEANNEANNKANNKANNETVVWTGFIPQVNFNPTHGFYNAPFSLVLTTTTPGATIHYTLDGSTPSETHGLIYSKPITINQTAIVQAIAFKPKHLPAPLNTQTYLFLDNVLTQSNTPPNFPTTWGHYQQDIEGHLTGSPVMADYEMDPDIVKHPEYKHQLKNSLTAIPSLSIVTDIKNFDIYANPREHGVDWERPVSVELIYPDSSTKDKTGFQINAGLRIQGGKGRREHILKHPFRLFFKNNYGAGKLDYPLFANSPVSSFDTLILRAGVNGSYAAVDQELATYTRDEWLRSSQIAISGVGSHGIFVHLYLNGLYWGLYNLVERPDASFAASYLGGEKEDWYARNHSGPISGPGDYTEGVRYNFINAQTPAEKYATLQDYIDPTQFSDYIILNWYAGNIDWARKNWYSAIRTPHGLVQYFIWDGEKTWIEGAKIDFNDPEKHKKFDLYPLFEALMWHPDFKMIFADRLYKHLFNNGPLTDKNAQARWQAINQPIQSAIIAESARWGDAKRDKPFTQQDWLLNQKDVLSQMEGNATKLINLARQAGYYPIYDPPIFNQHGGIVPFNFNLSLTAPHGSIYYTLDGSDPRQLDTSEISPTAIKYNTPIILNTTTHLKARVFINNTWSALNEATFFVNPTKTTPLAITEIMYNPPGGDDYEFIELKNITESVIDLSDMIFEGIGYTFPPNTTLAGGKFMVLVHNATAFSKRYPQVEIGGTYPKKLSNKGESLRITDSFGLPIISITYDDENGWPLSADGKGDSLTLINTTVNPNNPQSWQASSKIYGNPGNW